MLDAVLAPGTLAEQFDGIGNTRRRNPSRSLKLQPPFGGLSERVLFLA
ncbi:MAG TPA: hypothetical protein VI457_10325 [Methylococcaceae bacterium]|nr:hypothetical protein [Methylococcaceae bacterium]